MADGSLKVKPGDGLSAHNWNQLVDGQAVGLTLKGAGGITCKRIPGGYLVAGPTIGNSFWAEIQTQGPNGEADYSDERYWVKRYRVSNTHTDAATAAVTWEADVAPLNDWVTATNSLEVVNSSHTIAPNTLVKISYGQDQGYPPTTRYTFSLSGPAVIPVTLSQSGGANGSGTTAASYTYNAVNAITSQSISGGPFNVQWARPQGLMSVATHGIGYYDSNGDFHLMQTDEVPQTGGCS